MRLQGICDEIMVDVDGALGCALVDLRTGLPLAIKVSSTALLESGAMETMSAAGAEYFLGEVNHQLQGALRRDPGDAGDNGFVQEIQTTTDDTYHFMCVVPDNNQTVLILITDKTVNLGLGWVAMRRALRRVQQATRLPDEPDLVADSATDDGAADQLQLPAEVPTAARGQMTHRGGPWSARRR